MMDIMVQLMAEVKFSERMESQHIRLHLGKHQLFQRVDLSPDFSM